MEDGAGAFLSIVPLLSHEYTTHRSYCCQLQCIVGYNKSIIEVGFAAGAVDALTLAVERNLTCAVRPNCPVPLITSASKK